MAQGFVRKSFRRPSELPYPGCRNLDDQRAHEPVPPLRTSPLFCEIGQHPDQAAGVHSWALAKRHDAPAQSDEQGWPVRISQSLSGPVSEHVFVLGVDFAKIPV